MTQALRILIAGAGIGGLTAALTLSRQGHAVEVVEQAPVLGEIGAGVTLAPNAMRVYEHLGIADRIVAAGVEPARQRIQHWADGRTLVELERGPRIRRLYKAPYVYIHRADLHAILVDAVTGPPGVTIHLSAAATGARAADGIVRMDLADGRALEGDIAIGADGLKSALRAQFATEPPVFTGHVAWRALVPVAGAALEDLAQYPGMHIGPGRLMVRYPVRDATILNLVFFARQSGWTEEGWTTKAPIEDLYTTYAGWCPEVLTMIGAIDPAALYKWAIFARTPLSTWIRDERITLLGDAAHAMTPFMGQGASSAIEDAMILARALAASADAPEGLRRYEAARLARCTYIQTESNANADRLQGQEADLFGMGGLTNEETLGLFAYDAGEEPV